MQEHFTFRVKLGEYEVQLEGTREEVVKTIEELPELINKVKKAFENVKPKTVATLTVKTEPSKENKQTQKYPKILPTENCEEAVIRILETEYGKWRPRIMNELSEALQANELNYPKRILIGALNNLARKGKIRRWNTDAGFVYILVEKDAIEARGEAK